jgi:hypothetical protein
VAGGLLALGACRLPPETERGVASNVVVAGGLAYAALAGDGIGVFRVPEGALVRRVPPAAGMESVDDLALSDGLLFALDADDAGHLAVFSLARPEEPALATPPIDVAVGPFSGVSAARGRVIVSGGTSELSAFRYGADGRIDPDRSTIDLGRGQPDVLVAADGEHAFVSTHFSLLGDTFGLTTLALGPASAPVRALATLELDGAGFSAGGRRPANFPLEAALAGDRLLVAFGGGLAVIDVTDPSAPRLSNVVPLELAAVSVDARGSLAAVVGSSPSPALVLLDLGVTDGPRVIARSALPAGSQPTGVALGEGFATVAAQQRAVTVVPLP